MSKEKNNPNPRYRNRRERRAHGIYNTVPALPPTKIEQPPKKNSISLWDWTKAHKKALTLIGLVSSIITIGTYFFPTSEKKIYDGDLVPPLLAPPPEVKPSGSEITTIQTKALFDSEMTNKIPPISNRIEGIYIKDFATSNVMLFLGGLGTLIAPDSYYNTFDAFGEVKGYLLRSKKSITQFPTTNMIIGVKDERLYVSVKFRDIKTGHLIGEIKFNHYEIYEESALRFYSTKTSLKVLDKQGDMVFSLKYEKESSRSQSIHIDGYFNDPKVITVLNKDADNTDEQVKCYQKSNPNWEADATINIRKLKL